jgi:quercetin dioxygenase-like cupin family protein
MGNFIVEVAPKGRPPLHVHHNQEETIHALKGRYKVQIGDETFHLSEGGFAYLPSRIPHAFLNLTDEPGEIVVVYVPAGVPGGGHKFYEELARSCGRAHQTMQLLQPSLRSTT